MSKKEKQNTRRRLGKYDWLCLGIDVLSETGESGLRLDDLCEGLGVTKGSFYAHFESKAGFVQQLLDRWKLDCIGGLKAEAKQRTCKSAESRLLALMHMIGTSSSRGPEASIRAWAAYEPAAAKCIREVDRARLDHVRQIFHDIGFRGADLESRVELFVVYLSVDPESSLSCTESDADSKTALLHALFLRT